MKQFLHLWVPIFLSNSIIMLVGIFDMIFLSHYSPQHVAAMAVCLSIYSLLFVSGTGILQGMMQELAEAYGRRAFDNIQKILKQSILIVIVLSVFAGWLLTHADPLLHLLKADSALQALIQPCLWLLAWTLPAHLLVRILYILTQACGEAKRVFYANIFYLIFKVSLAYCLIFGIQGYVPAYGVKGAFIAHLTVQWALLVVYYLIFLEKQLRVHWSGQFFHFKTLLKILRIGLPSAIVVFIDVFTISVIALLILPLGEIIVNAHQVAMGLAGLLFMVPFSMSSAFSILVSTRIGANQVQSAWDLTFKALRVVVASAVVLAILIAIFQKPIVTLFSDNKDVLAVSLALMFLLCWMHIFDAILVVSVNMLRCWKVVIFPMFIFSGVLLLGGLGGGWYLAYHPVLLFNLNLDVSGISGFWWMLAISYTFAALMCLLCLGLKYRKHLQTA